MNLIINCFLYNNRLYYIKKKKIKYQTSIIYIINAILKEHTWAIHCKTDKNINHKSI